jgi:hypothetical protein
LFDPAYGEYMNDWDFWLRCLVRCNQVGFIAEPLVQVRSHPTQGGADVTKVNDATILMVQRLWKGAPLFSFYWWQREWLYLVLSSPYAYRSLKQALQDNFADSLNKGDGLYRIRRHLGMPRFLILLSFLVPFFPFRNWYSRYVSNIKPVLPDRCN